MSTEKKNSEKNEKQEVLTCSGCKSYCPLTNPTCGVGEQTAIAKGIPHKPVSAGKKRKKVVTDYNVTKPQKDDKFVYEKIVQDDVPWH